ncbi:uncharacterized protein LOC101214022 [Cucumis sativus]|uniref:Uncharacterized protein n=1 Tax=Cucumis sativus TaxID=3659 RepID=A0A0A0L0X5_CUCSA|nr:uncharacterized protein LOC101214022 [Cucumis sativus]KGN55595.1 hypothetical protein Csa_009725 [Cucumis sativus]
MEGNICDVNHLNSDVLLPPRKRLLAGLRKQGGDGDGTFNLPPVASSSCSPPPSPSYGFTSIEFNIRLNSLLSAHSNSNLSPEEIVQASRSAAAAAVKAAEAARAAAEEKAAIAARAVTVAKSAMDLVASISEEAAYKEINLRKNKLKKHVPVQLLYTKYQPLENTKTDEELARKLHRAINSSPRILKNSSGSDVRSHKHKKLKSSTSSEKIRVSNCGISQDLDPTTTCNGHAKPNEVDSECSFQEVYKLKPDEKTSKYEKSNPSLTDNGEETSQKEKMCDDISVTIKKRGRVKLKKLPLSICSFRDKTTLKEDMNNGSSPILTVQNRGSPTSEKVILHSVDSPTEGVMPIDSTSVWKCQEFKAPLSVKQNKVVQS